MPYGQAQNLNYARAAFATVAITATPAYPTPKTYQQPHKYPHAQGQGYGGRRQRRAGGRGGQQGQSRGGSNAYATPNHGRYGGRATGRGCAGQGTGGTQGGRGVRGGQQLNYIKFYNNWEMCFS